ncbi:hypothetical protein T484DRAFT_1971063 [Baffinella frigidus]|nr:hypothetical protein T484DRAFT_1971063 [Cryptophyta sp. CCMP2293]
MFGARWLAVSGAAVLLCAFSGRSGTPQVLLQGRRQQQLFERPSRAGMDADSWMLSGVLGDRLDGTQNPFVLPEDQKQDAGRAAMRAAWGVRGRQQQLFERPSRAGMDADSWMLSGVLGDRLDGTRNPFVLPEDQKPAMRSARTQSLLGGGDWLGAPLGVPEDVRDNGEQQIGEEVTYWQTHTGDIGTGAGNSAGASYPY